MTSKERTQTANTINIVSPDHRQQHSKLPATFRVRFGPGFPHTGSRNTCHITKSSQITNIFLSQQQSAKYKQHMMEDRVDHHLQAYWRLATSLSWQFHPIANPSRFPGYGRRLCIPGCRDNSDAAIFSQPKKPQTHLFLNNMNHCGWDATHSQVAGFRIQPVV